MFEQALVREPLEKRKDQRMKIPEMYCLIESICKGE